MTDALFEIPAGARLTKPAPASPDVRRRLGQHDTLAAGYHPLGEVESAFGGLKLHDQAAPLDDLKAPGRRCGNCYFRRVLPYRRKSYPKCLFPGNLGADEVDMIGPLRVTHGAASDCRAWWPACTDHSYGDPRMSEDAARWVPGAADGGEHA